MKTLFVSLLISLSALAEVGKVSLLQGTATRTPKEGTPLALKKGSPIELGDTIVVADKSMLRFELTDQSVIALDSKSELRIDEAEFEGQERKSFAGFLKLGSLWTKVKKTLTGAKFQVSTERAVAGVRGTVFRIDAETFLGRTEERKTSQVRVTEGVVSVSPSVALAKKMSKSPMTRGSDLVASADRVAAPSASPAAAAAPEAGGRSDSTSKAAKSNQRVEMAGPVEVNAADWEKHFVELKANQSIVVGVDLFLESKIDEKAQKDKFDKWIEKNSK